MSSWRATADGQNAPDLDERTSCRGGHICCTAGLATLPSAARFQTRRFIGREAHMGSWGRRSSAYVLALGVALLAPGRNASTQSSGAEFGVTDLGSLGGG